MKTQRRTVPRGMMHIRRNVGGKSFVLTVPAALARQIGPNRLFKVELVDEGILYRYVEGDGPTMPRWMT